MARTSRRNRQTRPEATPIVDSRIMKEPAAAYIRFSVEEGKGDTLETQLALVRDYIDQSGSMYLEDVYIDNGYTGTNFDRPEFTRMMTDVRSGKIKCIVVKDLSRFGRNFIESGYYIETLLPRLNVRFVAITDGFDSSRQSDQDAISVPIKNMVNEFYAKDYSKKISDMNASRRRSGNYTIEKALYGYIVDKENNEYVINPDTAPIVQLIFRWYLSGIGAGAIATRLNLLGIMTPKEYKSLYETGEEMTSSRLWTHGKVLTIIVRDAYAGDRCLGTRLSAQYKNCKDVEIPRENWIIYKDDHDPLVTREDFAKANQMFRDHVEASRAAVLHGKEVNPELDNLFSKMIYCGKCNRIMLLEAKRYRDGLVKTEGMAYVCKGMIGPESQRGCRRSIDLDLLKIIVNDQLQMMIDVMLDQQKVIAKLRKNHSEKNPVQRYKTRLSSLEMKEIKCGDRIAKLYEDLASGTLEMDDYITLKERYQKERESYGQQINEYRTRLSLAQKNMDAFDDIVETLKEKYLHAEFSRELLDFMVEKIVVFDDKHIEIRFKFDDVLQSIKEIVEGGEKE